MFVRALTLVKIPLCFPTDSELKKLSKPYEFTEAVSKKTHDWILTIANPKLVERDAPQLATADIAALLIPKLKDQERLEIVGKV